MSKLALTDCPRPKRFFSDMEVLKMKLSPLLYPAPTLKLPVGPSLTSTERSTESPWSVFRSEKILCRYGGVKDETVAATVPCAHAEVAGRPLLDLHREIH